MGVNTFLSVMDTIPSCIRTDSSIAVIPAPVSTTKTPETAGGVPRSLTSIACTSEESTRISQTRRAPSLRRWVGSPSTPEGVTCRWPRLQMGMDQAVDESRHVYDVRLTNDVADVDRLRTEAPSTELVGVPHRIERTRDLRIVHEGVLAFV